jgi:hypothetical protein
MKKYMLFIISTITFGCSTELSGYFNGYLPLEDSPYYITGDLIISDSLVIEAGCIIHTNPNCRIMTGVNEDSFDAYIRAEGTEMDSIIFTHNPNQLIIGWGGIYLGHAPEKKNLYLNIVLSKMHPELKGEMFTMGVVSVVFRQISLLKIQLFRIII